MSFFPIDRPVGSRLPRRWSPSNRSFNEFANSQTILLSPFFSFFHEDVKSNRFASAVYFMCHCQFATSHTSDQSRPPSRRRRGCTVTRPRGCKRIASRLGGATTGEARRDESRRRATMGELTQYLSGRPSLPDEIS